MFQPHPSPIKYRSHLIYDVSKFSPIDKNKFEICTTHNEHVAYATTFDKAKAHIDSLK